MQQQSAADKAEQDGEGDVFDLVFHCLAPNMAPEGAGWVSGRSDDRIGHDGC